MAEKKDAATASEEAAPLVPEPAVPAHKEDPPGGKFFTADGIMVNCWNQHIDENGKVLDETPLPRG
jgi:hypothetical protein